jgi:hypothetical protein
MCCFLQKNFEFFQKWNIEIRKGSIPFFKTWPLLVSAICLDGMAIDWPAASSPKRVSVENALYLPYKRGIMKGYEGTSDPFTLKPISPALPQKATVEWPVKRAIS